MGYVHMRLTKKYRINEINKEIRYQERLANIGVIVGIVAIIGIGIIMLALSYL